jgi:methionyl-tRNA formyltransferase
MIIIAGKNKIAVDGLTFLVDSGVASVDNILALPVSSDDGTDGWQPSLRSAANRIGIRAINFDEASQQVSSTFISLEYDRIIRTSDFRSHALFNVHFSALPKFKGCWNSIHPILQGETESGVTLHLIDDGIDTGAVVDQLRFSIDPAETAFSLYGKFQKYGLEIFRKNIGTLQEGSYTATPQSRDGSTYFSRKSLDPRLTEIDVMATCHQIDRQVRALYFPVYQMATYRGRAVAQAGVLSIGVQGKIGTVVSATETFADVQCVDGIVRLTYAAEKR